MKPLKVERLGTMKEPISVYSLVSRLSRGFPISGSEVGFRVGPVWRSGIEDATGSGAVVGEPAGVARSELAVDAVERDLRTLI
jgi:hypothetical protein